MFSQICLLFSSASHLLSVAKFPTTSTKVTNTNTNTKCNEHRNVHVRKCFHKYVFLGRQTLALFQSNFEIQMITQTLTIANIANTKNYTYKYKKLTM